MLRQETPRQEVEFSNKFQSAFDWKTRSMQMGVTIDNSG